MFDCLNTAGVGGYAYLLEPLWWLGMITSKCFLLGLFEFLWVLVILFFLVYFRFGTPMIMSTTLTVWAF